MRAGAGATSRRRSGRGGERSVRGVTGNGESRSFRCGFCTGERVAADPV